MTTTEDLKSVLDSVGSSNISSEDYKFWLIKKVVEKMITSIPPKVAFEIITKDSGAWIDVKITSAPGNQCHVSTSFDLKPKSSIIY